MGRSPYSPETFQKALAFSERGLNSTAISAEIGVPTSTIRRWLDRGIQERRLYSEDDRIIIPACVLEDRSRRAGLVHTSTTAELMGDPLPGQSYLDKIAMRAETRAG